MKPKIFLAAFAFSVTASQGAVFLGSDIASNSAYSSGWNDGTDGGTAATFGAWTLTKGGSNSGQFLDSSTSLNSPGADIDTARRSFGMFGHTGETSESFRNFNGNSLAAGQTFSFDLAVNFRNGSKGFDLRDSVNNVIFNFNITGDDYLVNNAATGNGSIGNDYSDNTAFQLSFTQSSAVGGTWSIVRSGGVSDSDSGTYTGVAENFKFYESQTADGSDANNLFFNNLTVVPEPTSAVLGLLGATLLLRRRRS